MDCQHCEDQLLPLVEGELPPAEAGEVRAHATACDACGQALTRLESGHRLAAMLPADEPTGRAHARIMEAARTRAAARSAPGAAAEGPAEQLRGTEGGWLGSVVEWLRGLSVGPQVAMAMVMLLVVAIGLLYLPDLRKRADEVQGAPVIHPEATGEAAPTASLEPAADEEEAEGVPAQSPSPQPAEEKPPEAKAEQSQARQGSPRRIQQRLAARERRSRSARPAPRAGAAPSGEANDAVSAFSGTARKKATARSGSGAGLAEGAPVQQAAPPAKGAPAPSAPSRAAAAEAQAEPATRSIARDEAVTERGDTARLAEARRARKARDYRAAARAYEVYLRSAPPGPTRGQAMLEAASCYQYLGQLDRARHWLLAAAREPSTAVAARQKLRALPSSEAEPAEPAAAAAEEPSN